MAQGRRANPGRLCDMYVCRGEWVGGGALHGCSGMAGCVRGGEHAGRRLWGREDGGGGVGVHCRRGGGAGGTNGCGLWRRPSAAAADPTVVCVSLVSRADACPRLGGGRRGVGTGCRGRRRWHGVTDASAGAALRGASRRKMEKSTQKNQPRHARSRTARNPTVPASLAHTNNLPPSPAPPTPCEAFTPASHPPPTPHLHPTHPNGFQPPGTPPQRVSHLPLPSAHQAASLGRRRCSGRPPHRGVRGQLLPQAANKVVVGGLVVPVVLPLALGSAVGRGGSLHPACTNVTEQKKTRRGGEAGQEKESTNTRTKRSETQTAESIRSIVTELATVPKDGCTTPDPPTDAWSRAFTRRIGGHCHQHHGRPPEQVPLGSASSHPQLEWRDLPVPLLQPYPAMHEAEDVLA